MNNTYRRKLQIAGGRSFAVTLPKGWIADNKLSPGDHLLLQIKEDGSLVIAPEKTAVQPTSSSLLIKESRRLVRDLIWGYLLGYDHIIVTSDKGFPAKLLSEAKKTIRGLAGAEIIEEAPNKIEVQILLDPEAVEPTKVLHRQNALVTSMINDAVQAFVNWDLDRAESTENRDEEVDRHYFTLVRVVRAAIRDLSLARKLNITPLRLMDIRLVAKLLEEIGDKAASLASIVKTSHDYRPSSQILIKIKDIGEHLSKNQSEAFDAFLKCDPELAINVINKKGEIDKLIGTILSLANNLGENLPIILRACFYLEDISNDQIDIADIAAPLFKGNTK
ncbi:MAG: phosphate uptake regulator PhoU [Nitrososphaerota archaeon]